MYPRRPGWSLAASFLIPGLGTILNAETGKGILILGGFLVSCLLIFAAVGLLLAPAVWIYGMYDAYQGARRFNLAHGFPPGG